MSRKKAFSFIIVFSIGLLVGGVVVDVFFSKTIVRGSIYRAGLQTYINPILSCDIAPPDTVFPEFKSLQKAIDASAQALEQRTGIKSVSVYLRTLNSGRWVSYKADKTYVPGSLMKVVLLIAYMKGIESDPKIAEHAFIYNKIDPPEYRPDGTEILSLKRGVAYTVKDLLKRMIVDSSNAAALLLAEYADEEALRSVFVDLQLPVQNMTKDGLIPVSPIQYSTAFKVLYNATYIDRYLSEQALTLLGQTSYKNGLLKGIPENILVSHKYGYFLKDVKNLHGDQELNDCGIVYYPDHPYFLCVMTEGSDYGALEGAVSTISATAYRGIDELFTKLAAQNSR